MSWGMRRRLSPPRFAASLAALGITIAAPIVASAGPTFGPADAASIAAPGPAEASTPIDVELRMAAGIARSTDGDVIPMLDGYAVVRRGPFVFGLAAQRAHGVNYTEVDTRLAVAAGLGWADDRFRATLLGMAGVAWWDNRELGRSLGREDSERTAFFGVRGDAEVRLFTLGAMKAYAGVWAAGTVDTSQDRLAVPFEVTRGDPEWFIKGQTRVMGGLQLGLTF